MIEFKEGQTKIYIGKNKIEKSSIDGHLDLHIVFPEDIDSGYEGKFVRIVAFENKYPIGVIKKIAPKKCEDDIPEIVCFENGGYLFDKNLF